VSTVTDEFNPYAAPQTESPLLPADDAERPAVWRDGRLVIIPHGAELPDRCWKCNAPAHGLVLRRQFSWHPPVYFLILLLGVLPYLVVAILVSRKAKVSLGICDYHLAHRRRNLAVAWTLALAGIGLMIGRTLTITDARISIRLFYIVGIALLVVGILYGIAFATVGTPRRIDKHAASISGAGRPFLDSLPDAMGQTAAAA
jgi:hypothetical protein